MQSALNGRRAASTFTLEGKDSHLDWATEDPEGTDNLALWEFATVRVKKLAVMDEEF